MVTLGDCHRDPEPAFSGAYNLSNGGYSLAPPPLYCFVACGLKRVMSAFPREQFTQSRYTKADSTVVQGFLTGQQNLGTTCTWYTALRVQKIEEQRVVEACAVVTEPGICMQL